MHLRRVAVLLAVTMAGILLPAIPAAAHEPTVTDDAYAYEVCVDDFSTTDPDGLGTPGDDNDNGVLANDDHDGSGEIPPHTAGLNAVANDGSTIEGGTFNLETTGLFTYTAPPGFVGDDTFTYTARTTDEPPFQTEADGTVTISVTQVDDPTTTDDFYATDENVNVNEAAPGVLGNDTSPNGGLAVSNIGAQPTAQGGVIIFSADGSFAYDPPADQDNLLDSVSYHVVDACNRVGSATIVFKIGNRAPVAADDVYTTGKNTASVPESLVADDVDGTAEDPDPDDPNNNGVLINDSDPDGDSIEVSDSDALSVEGGTVSVATNGTFTYVPFEGFSGTDSFSYEINDGSAPGENPTDTATVTITVVNGAPEAVDDPFFTDVDTPIETGGDLLANDSDPEGDAISTVASAGASAEGGVFEVFTDGTFDYIPPTGFEGVDSFTYTTTDDDPNNPETDTATVLLFVGNQAPVAEDDPFYSTDPGIPLTTTDADGTAEDPDPDDTSNNGVLKNDTDSDGPAALTASTPEDDFATSLEGFVILNEDGTFTYSPPDDVTEGIDSFVYIADDGHTANNTDTATAYIKIGNRAPTPEDDFYEAEPDTTLIVDDVDGEGTEDPNDDSVLLNDSDPDAPVDGPPAAIAETVTSTEGGPDNVVISDNGTFTYEPPAGFVGIDTFTYQAIDDDGAFTEAIVTVKVGNNPPVAVDDAYDAQKGAALVVNDASGTATGTTNDDSVLLNDSDPDGDTLVVSAYDATGTAGGTVSMSADGTFTYTPPAGTATSDTFTYTIDDGDGGEDTATVTITINQPVVAVDDFYATNEGGTITADDADGSVGGTEDDGVLVNDQALEDEPGGDDDTLTVVAATDVATTAGGSVDIAADGTFVYSAPATYSGNDTFEYTVQDGRGSSDIGLVTISVNGAPMAVDDDFYEIATDEVLTTTDADGLTTVGDQGDDGALANDIDPDGDALSAVVEVGKATSGGGTVDINGDGTFTYTPDTGFTGDDTFTYTVEDPDGLSDEGLVTITVNAAPVLAADSYATTRNAALTTTDVDGTADANANNDGLLANDTDPEGDTFTVTSIDDSATDGTVTFNPNGTFTYTPTPGFVGETSFDYTVTDELGNEATETATITVTNQAPTPADDVYEIKAGESLTTTDADGQTTVGDPADDGLLANDTDPDGDDLDAVEEVGKATSGGGTVDINADGTFTYTPDTGFTGDDTFTYTVDDGEDQVEASVTITVNAPPDLLPDSYATTRNAALTTTDVDGTADANANNDGLLANDTDPEGDTFTVTSIDDSATDGTVTFNPNGTFTYTPTPGFVGETSFDYTVTDELGNEATETATITVTNGAPVATDDEYNTLLGTPLQVAAPGVLGNDVDPDGDDLEVIAASDGKAIFETSTAQGGTVSIDSDGSFTYTPPAGFIGADSFNYTMTDGVSDDLGAVTLNVNAPANQAPTAPDVDLEVIAPASLNVPAPGALGASTDPDGDTLTITSTGARATSKGGTVNISSNGAFTYQPPDAEFRGLDSFTYAISDGKGGTDSGVIRIDIRNARTITDSCPRERVPDADLADVDPGSTHFLAIECLLWWKVTSGTGTTKATLYSPLNPVTREQMATFIVNFLDKTSPGFLPASGPDAFDDDNGSVHEANINRLAAKKIVAGKGDRVYDPKGIVTRAQMATFIVNMLGLTGDPRADYYSDDNTSVHERNINLVSSFGIASGKGGGIYDPAGPTRRDQMGSFLARSLDLLVDFGGAPLPDE